MLRSLVLTACLALLSLSANALEPPKPAETWVGLEAENFHFISNASARQTREVARDLLRMRAALGKVTDFNLHTAAPTRVFLFRTQTRFAAYCQATRGRKCDNVNGVFLGNGTENFILLPADAPGGVDRVVYHELTHNLMANTNSRLPLWFHEGLAEYFSTYRTAGDQTHLGVPIDEHVRWLAAGSLIPLRDLFATTPSSPIYNEGTRTGVFHAQSWALVHYLLHDAGRRVKLQRFLAVLGGGISTDAAFEIAFEMPYRELEQALRAYIRGATFTVYALPFGDLTVSQVPEPAAMPHDAVLHQLGRLLGLTRPQNAATAERFFQESLAANEKNALARADLGYLYEITGRKAEASAAYAKAVAVGSDDAEVYQLAGRGILKGEVREFVKARPLFQRATELDPKSAQAWRDLGATYLGETDGHAPGIAALEKSLALNPRDEYAAFYLTQLWSIDGRNHATVRKLASELLARTSNEALRGPLTNMLAVASINAAVEKANAGNYTEALAIVEALLPQVRDPESRKQALMVRDMIAAEAKKRK